MQRYWIVIKKFHKAFNQIDFLSLSISVWFCHSLHRFRGFILILVFVWTFLSLFAELDFKMIILHALN